MIQILKIHIEEFRGIRKLDLLLDAKSFVVHGPNGSGKSGVVDAIGFAFTGTIARLTGPGTAGISVQKHGPHVHRRDDPAAAKVSVEFRDTVSGQTGTITRSVKNAATYTLVPDTSELQAAVETIRRHPELTLSRREIIKFILSESGKRATEVQALLQLDALDDQRKALKAALTKLGKDKGSAQSALNGAQATMLRHLDLPKLAATDVLEAINQRRQVLGLTPLTTLTFGTDLKQGIDQDKAEVAFDKASALRDVEALQQRRSHADEFTEAIQELAQALEEFGDDVSVLESLKHRSLVETGLALLLDEAVCPLCDTQWESVEELRKHLQEKFVLSEAIARREQQLKKAAAGVIALLRSEHEITKPVQKLVTAWGTPAAQIALQAWQDKLVSLETKLATVTGVLELRDEITNGLLETSPELTTELETLSTTLASKPDTTAKAEAQSYLIIAGERWTQLRLARQAQIKANAAHGLADRVYQTFCTITDQALANLYDEVEARFSAFYCQINAEDEAGFKAELEPSAGSLDLLVDFYGLGMFPPGAYHSEGHQDGMGVCLYLALVEKLLGPAFRFAVLDDVVMSVDSNHRRQFCELLKKEFPDVQFIITTHDEIWAKEMQTSGLVSKRSHARFQGWSVDTGPAYEQGSDFWDKIDADLAKDDVHSAAFKLRRGLEAELPELAEGIGARVTYRGDARYELGELLDAIKGRYSDLLKKATKSADSWNSATAKQQIQQLKEARAAAILAQGEENWAINALVHYNKWATMTKKDFIPVVQACKDFLQLFRCENDECESWITVTGSPGNESALRCRCGEYSLNLLSKVT